MTNNNMISIMKIESEVIIMKKIDDFGSGATLEIIKLLATKIFKEKIGL